MILGDPERSAVFSLSCRASRTVFLQLARARALQDLALAAEKPRPPLGDLGRSGAIPLLFIVGRMWVYSFLPQLVPCARVVRALEDLALAAERRRPHYK